MKKTQKLLSLLLAILMLITSLPLSGLVAFGIGDSPEDVKIDAVPEAPDGYTNSGIVAYDENGIPIYQFDSAVSESGLINQKWINAFGEEVSDPLHEPAYPKVEHLDMGENDLPEAYDARDYGLVTPVEYQIGGTCWAHAAAACLETNFIKKGYGTNTNTNLCEYHIAWFSKNSYFAGIDDSANDGYTVANPKEALLDYGGNPGYVERALESYSGAAYESNIGITATTDDEKDAFFDIMAEKLTFDKRYIPDITLDSVKTLNYDNTEIKQGILDYGAVFIAYYSSGNGKNGNPVYYNYTLSNGQADYWYLDDDQVATYYCPVETETDHAVTIVGWDDNFPKENFGTNIPEGNGAWLIKNSWSEAFCNDGYVWISYYDKSLARPYVFSAEDPDLFDNVYLYDGANYLYSRNGSAYANIFTAKGNEYLTMINNPKQAYTLKVYKNIPENATDPTAGTLAYTQSGAAPTGKYLAITGDVPLTAGERYSVVIEGSKIYYEGTGATLTSKVGDSFYKDADGNWCDSSADGYGNVGIRAFTNLSEEGESYKVILTDGDNYQETLYSENGTVTLPTKENYTYTFSYGGETFDGTGVTKDMYVDIHCYPTNGIRKGDTPCTLEYTCIYCGIDMKESITEHSYQSETVEASPTQIGHTAHICSVCGDCYYTDRAFYSGATKSGVDGDMWWQFCNGTLVINGIGATPDYTSYSKTPWASFFYDINKVYVSDGITVIGDYLFASLTGLTEISLPDSVETISKYSLNATTHLKNIELPANLKSIETYAFAGSAINELTWNSKLETIGDYAFYSCHGLTEITVPAIPNLGTYPFYNCKNLKKVIVEEGITYVDYIFENIECIDEVVLPSTLSDGFFASFSNVLKFTVHPNNKFYKSVDGILYNKNGTVLERYPTARDDIYFKVPSTVTEFGQYSFYGLNSLKYLDLSETKATALSFCMFKNSDVLTNINLPAGLTGFRENAFDKIDISALFIPSSVSIFYSASNVSKSETSKIYTDKENSLIKSWASDNSMSCATNHTSHNYSTVAETIFDGDCSNGAQIIKTCECGQFILDVTEPTVLHTPTDNGIVTTPTCTDDGYTTHICSVCGISFTSDPVTAIGHSYIWVIDKNATCGATGIEHEECSVCKVKRNENTSIPATGVHSYTAKDVKAEALKKAATCTNADTYYYSCAFCGKIEKNDSHTFTKGSALPHSFSWITDKNANCGVNGIKHEECSVCHTKRNEGTAIPATGAHSYTSKIVAPTCTADGYTLHTCTVCTYSYKSDTVKTSGHSFGAWETVTSPTCSVNGSDKRVCSKCNTTETRQTTKDHAYTTITGLAPTCGDDGYSDYLYCTDCGSTENYQVLKATGKHTDGDGNGICDVCSKNMAADCDCICHNDNAFMKFIYKIVSFFWKLFKMSQTCECGKAHY